jgi:alkylhydroperoxidase family enzyme
MSELGTHAAIEAIARNSYGRVPEPPEWHERVSFVLDAIYSARLPAAFGMFYGKVSKLDQKLALSPEMILLIRHQVARINICLFCIDIARSFTIKASMNEAKFDALDQYPASPLYTDAERAALTELTEDKKVNPDTFARMSRHYSEREICEIVWLVASEHLYNMTNIGLNIHSDMLCDIAKRTSPTGRSASSSQPTTPRRSWNTCTLTTPTFSVSATAERLRCKWRSGIRASCESSSPSRRSSAAAAAIRSLGINEEPAS